MLELQEADRRRELEIEFKLKEQRQAPTQSQSVPKRFKVADSRSGGQPGRACGKCGKVYIRSCRSGRGCQKYGKEGHYARDRRQSAPVPSMRICYHCDQVGHVKVNFLLLVDKSAQAPAPATLRIIDGVMGVRARRSPRGLEVVLSSSLSRRLGQNQML